MSIYLGSNYTRLVGSNTQVGRQVGSNTQVGRLVGSNTQIANILGSTYVCFRWFLGYILLGFMILCFWILGLGNQVIDYYNTQIANILVSFRWILGYILLGFMILCYWTLGQGCYYLQITRYQNTSGAVIFASSKCLKGLIISRVVLLLIALQ